MQDFTRAFSDLTDAVADKLSAEIKAFRHEAAQERELRVAQFATAMAEISAQKALMVDAIARMNERADTVKDGVDGTNGLDGKDAEIPSASEIADLIRPDVVKAATDMVSSIPIPKDGVDGSDGADGQDGRDGVDGKNGVAPTAEQIAALVMPEAVKAAAAAVAEIPAPNDGVDGKDADMDVLKAHLEELVSAIPAPKNGVDGSSVAVEDIEPLLRSMVEAIPPAKDGIDGVSITVDDVEPLVRSIVEATIAKIPTPKDGIDGTSVTVDDVVPMIETKVAELVSAIPVPKDGRDAVAATAAEIAELVIPEVAKHAESVIASWDKPKDGKDADMDVLKSHIEELVSAIPPAKDGEPGKDGKLPVVIDWEDKVYFEGEVVTKDGSVFQAIRTTGKQPGHDDWNCIVMGGTTGADGKSPEPRGLFDAESEYNFLDIVMLNGASFIAKRDNPGSCPGAGWNLLAGPGKQGKPGLPGAKGERGLTSVSSVRAVDVSEDGLLVVANSDGTTVECDLYPLLAKVA